MTAARLALGLLLLAACGADDDVPLDADGGDADAAPVACDPEAPGTICTIIGNGRSGYDGDEDIVALDARLSLPTDVLVADDGTVYVLDWNNHRIRSWSPDDKVLKHVAGRGELGGTLDDPANSDFNHPTGMVFTPDGSGLVVAAWHNSKIRTIDLTSEVITDTVGDGRRAYFGDDDADGPVALDLPASVAYAPDGDLVILDQANQVIRSLDEAGVVHRIAGVCVTDNPLAGGVACEAGETPVQCPGGSGKLTCGVPPEGCAGACNPGYAVGEDALSMRMAQPFGQSADPGGRMVYDAAGDLYFADTSNHLIRRVTAAGAVEVVVGVAPVGGIAQSGTSADGTAATETLLDRPTDLALAADGTLYFTDVYNHCVRKLAPDGKVYTVAGVCGEKGTAGDGGPPNQARLKLPYGVALAGDRLYVSDSGNQTIRVVNLP